MELTFEIQYDAVVNKNKNLFYFINYCQDIQEFKNWLEYNDITLYQYNQLNDEMKELYCQKKIHNIIEVMVIYQNDIKNIKRLPRDIQNIQRKIILRDIYDYFLDNKYFINHLKDRSNDINKIFNYFNENISIFRRI